MVTNGGLGEFAENILRWVLAAKGLGGRGFEYITRQNTMSVGVFQEA